MIARQGGDQITTCTPPYSYSYVYAVYSKYSDSTRNRFSSYIIIRHEVNSDCITTCSSSSDGYMYMHTTQHTTSIRNDFYVQKPYNNKNKRQSTSKRKLLWHAWTYNIKLYIYTGIVTHINNITYKSLALADKFAMQIDLKCCYMYPVSHDCILECDWWMTAPHRPHTHRLRLCDHTHNTKDVRVEELLHHYGLL